MSIFDYFKKKLIKTDKDVNGEKNGKIEIEGKEALETEFINNDDLNLKWQDVTNDNRFKDLIEYFTQCLVKDNDEKVLKNVNDIFSYQKNLKKLFANKEISNLDIKLLAILMNLLNSDNMYRQYYERYEQGISYLKFLLKKIYIDVYDKDNLQKEKTNNLNLDSTIDKAFIVEQTKKYKIKDFLNEYKDILNDSVSEEDYKLSYFERHYFKNNPFDSIALNRNIFNINIEDDKMTILKKFNYMEMTSTEIFTFIMNYIVAMNYIMIGKYNRYIFSVPIDVPFIEFGSQNLKKEKTVLGNISGVSLIERHYEESGVSFDPDPSREEGEYNFKIRTESGLYDLLTLCTKSDSNDSISFDNTNQGEMINASGRTDFMGCILTEEGYNLNYSQFQQIIKSLEKVIFDNNGAFNVATYNYIVPCMFGLIAYVKSMTSSDYYDKMEEDLSNFIKKIKESKINYLDKKNYQKVFTDFSDEDNKNFSDHLNLFYFKSIAPFCRKIYSAFEQYNTILRTFEDVKESIDNKYRNYKKTKETARENYNKMINNFEEILNYNDGETVEKILNVYHELGETHEEGDDPKRL